MQPSFGAAGVRIRHTASVGEDVGETGSLASSNQGHHVLRVGMAEAPFPAPYGVAVCTDAPGDLRPRQAGLPLETLQAFREVGGGIGAGRRSPRSVATWSPLVILTYT